MKGQTHDSLLQGLSEISGNGEPLPQPAEEVRTVHEHVLVRETNTPPTTQVDVLHGPENPHAVCETRTHSRQQCERVDKTGTKDQEQGDAGIRQKPVYGGTLPLSLRQCLGRPHWAEDLSEKLWRERLRSVNGDASQDTSAGKQHHPPVEFVSKVKEMQDQEEEKRMLETELVFNELNSDDEPLANFQQMRTDLQDRIAEKEDRIEALRSQLDLPPLSGPAVAHHLDTVL